MESDLDDVVMDALPPARKRGIIIELVANPTLPTVRLNGNNAMRQGSFEDINWETRRLETEDEKMAEWSKDTKEMREERKAEQIQELADQIERSQRKKDLTRERQRRHRALLKEQNPKPKKRVKNINDVSLCMNFCHTAQLTLMQVLRDPGSDSAELAELSELSRPNSNWKSGRNGKRGGAKQSQHKRTNWYHPFLWTYIDNAARKVGWSAHSITNRLICDQPKLFGHITKGTVQKWIDKDTKRGWSAATKKNIERRHALTGSGQTGILARHLDIVKEIKAQLQALRTSGLAVNVLVARSIMLAIIKERQPDLLTEFKCSEVHNFIYLFIYLLTPPLFQSFVRSFFESVMNWTPRKGT